MGLAAPDGCPGACRPHEKRGPRLWSRGTLSLVHPPGGVSLERSRQRRSPAIPNESSLTARTGRRVPKRIPRPVRHLSTSMDVKKPRPIERSLCGIRDRGVSPVLTMYSTGPGLIRHYVEDRQAV
jgi:hypothetical protein